MTLPHYRSSDWRNAHWFYRGLYATIRGPIKRGFQVHARGMEHTPREGGVVVAMNHFSWIDPIVASDVLPRPVFYLAKEELFDGPVRSWFFSSIGQIKVDRREGGNEAAVERALELLDDGCCVGVYPEGTRSTYESPLRARRGVARMALAADVPILPVALLTHHAWPKTQNLPTMGVPIYVNVGEPLRFPDLTIDHHDRDVTQKVAEEAMSRVRALLHEAEAAFQAQETWEWG